MLNNSLSLRIVVYTMDYFAEAQFFICIHQLYLLNIQPARTFVGDSDPELDDLEKWMIHGRHLMDFSHWQTFEILDTVRNSVIK